MVTADTFSTTLSFYGRFIDFCSRDILPAKTFSIGADIVNSEPLYKSDGYFSFYDFPASIAPYRFNVIAKGYRRRSFLAPLPAGGPVEITYDGEDEVYLFVNLIDTPTNRIDFDAIAFLPVILKGAEIRGPGGFSTTLAESIGGSDVSIATLASTAGLTTGDLLCIKRSNQILLYPDWTYLFSEPTTALYVMMAENVAEHTPVENVRIELTEVTGNPVTSLMVQGLTLYRVNTGASNDYILGTEQNIIQFSDYAGKGLLFFPETLSIASVTLQISHPGYISQNVTIPLITGKNTYHTFFLLPL